MAAITTAVIGAVGVASSAAGLALQKQGQKKATKAFNEAAAAQQQQERVRERQMELESMRQQRKIYRESLKNRALGLSNASAAGAQEGSGVQGGFAQIIGDTGRETLALAQNTEIGGEMFALNREITAAETRANAGKALASTGSGLFSMGGSLISNAPTIANIGTTLFGSSTDATKVR